MVELCLTQTLGPQVGILHSVVPCMGKGSHSTELLLPGNHFIFSPYALPTHHFPSFLSNLNLWVTGFLLLSCFALRQCHTLSLWLAWNLHTPRPECCDSCLWAWLILNGKKTSYQVGYPYTKPARLLPTLPISFLLHYNQNKQQNPVIFRQSSVHQQGSGSCLGLLCLLRVHTLFSGHTVHFPCPTGLAS